MVPAAWIGRRVEVRETKEKIEIELDARHLVTHVRAVGPHPQQMYPREPFLVAVGEAARYGLYDLDRLERMILRRVARDYFLPRGTDPDGDD